MGAKQHLAKRAETALSTDLKTKPSEEHPVRILSTVAVSVLVVGRVFAGEAVVELTRANDIVNVTIGGEAFAVYNFGKTLPKPFFSPVRGPDGMVMTRPIEKLGDDHPHHKGIWLAVDEINEIQYWAERGKIENVRVDVMAPVSGAVPSHYWAEAVRRYRAAGGDSLSGGWADPAVAGGSGPPASIQVVNHWLDAQAQPVVIETTRINIFPNRLIAYDITFTAGSKPASFLDTKEGLLGFRMVDSMREQEGGRVVNADGLKGTAECWGKTSDWVDYCGEIDGKTYGISIFDHAGNFRRSRYHVRNYGLFSINPFGDEAYTKGRLPAKPLKLAPGSSVRLRYAMYIHAGDTLTADVAGAYRKYLAMTQ